MSIVITCRRHGSLFCPKCTGDDAPRIMFPEESPNPFIALGREDRRAKFLDQVDKLAAKHGMTRRALLSLLTDNSAEGWRPLFGWVEFNNFTEEELQ